MDREHGHERPLVEVRLDPARLRRWHLWLLEELEDAGMEVRIAPASAAGLPPAARALLLLERVLYGGRHAMDAVDGGMLPRMSASGTPVAVIDLTGRKAVAGDKGVLVPLYDGVPEEGAAMAAVLDGRAPFLEIAAGAEGRRVSVGLPAMEDASVVSRALDPVMARMCQGLVRPIRNGFPETDASCNHVRAKVVSRSNLSAGRISGFAAASLAARIARRIAALAGRKDDVWMVGWRNVAPGEGLLETGVLDEDAYRILPDDGRRYLADPFVFVKDGRRFVFVEEFPFTTGKGVISVLEVDSKGEAGERLPVLDEDVHLSYPHVFASDGEIWMIPESGGAREVRLYRCVSFPDRWERVAVLVKDQELSDATVCRIGGLWWMFATERTRHGSSWDALAIFRAERLTGPWHPHPANPVLVDAGQARPAGAVHVRKGRILRPVQDCRGGYGAGLAICRVDRIDEACYLQKVTKNVHPRAKKGIHTLNAAGGLEVVDFFGRPPASRGKV